MCNILKPVCIPTYFALLLMSMSASAYADTINDTQLKILRGDRKLGDRGRFGRLVCMSGDHAIIGAHSIYAPYVFMRGGDAWIEQAKLREDDLEPDLLFDPVDTNFGISVALDGVHAVVATTHETRPDWSFLR